MTETIKEAIDRWVQEAVDSTAQLWSGRNHYIIYEAPPQWGCKFVSERYVGKDMVEDRAFEDEDGLRIFLEQVYSGDTI